MQGKPNSSVAMGDALQGVEGRQPVERRPPGVLPGLGLALDAALLHEVKHGGQQAEAERSIGQQQGGNVGHQPADAHALRGKCVAIRAPARERRPGKMSPARQRFQGRWRRRATRRERTGRPRRSPAATRSRARPPASSDGPAPASRPRKRSGRRRPFRPDGRRSCASGTMP